MDFITLYMEPPTSTAQEKGFNYRTGNIYLKSGARKARQDLKRELVKYRPIIPYDEPISLKASFFYPPTNKAKKQLRNRDWILKATKPDLDNSLKLLLDVMQETGYFTNDSRIYSLWAEKFYTSAEPRIEISISQEY